MATIKTSIVSEKRTICEAHREIYDLLCENGHKIDPKLRDELERRLQEVYRMGKKMDAKLRQYKFNYDDKWWETQREKIIREKIIKRNKRQKEVIKNKLRDEEDEKIRKKLKHKLKMVDKKLEMPHLKRRGK